MSRLNLKAITYNRKLVLQRFEKKVATTINVFFLLGLISVGLGFITIFDGFAARLFVAVLFFFLGVLFLHIAYHIQDLRNHLAGMMSVVDTSITKPVEGAVKKVMKRKKS